MTTIHLTISRDYVSTWSIWEAAREFVQNALDTSKYTVGYDVEKGRMTIRSEGGVLDKKNLILGITTKRDDDSTIGTYGEGFKLAMLVLLREGKKVIVHNGNDLWTPHFDQHPSLHTECLAVTIQENVLAHNEGCVEFIIDDLTTEEIALIQEKTLYNFDKNIIEASHNGSFCWRDDSDVSKLYVGSLFVCDLEKGYEMNYNFAPNVLQLDRDRKSVSGFYLSLEATKMIALSGNYDLLAELAENQAEDVSDYYVTSYHSYGQSDEANTELKEVLSTSFVQKHGINAYPINASSAEKEKRVQTVKAIEAGLVPVVVKSGYYNLLNASLKEKEVTRFKAFNVNQEIMKFYEENKSQLRGKPLRALKKLVVMLELYEGKIDLPPSVKSKLIVDTYETEKPKKADIYAPAPPQVSVVDGVIWDDIPF